MISDGLVSCILKQGWVGGVGGAGLPASVVGFDTYLGCCQPLNVDDVTGQGPGTKAPATGQP